MATPSSPDAAATPTPTVPGILDLAKLCGVATGATFLFHVCTVPWYAWQIRRGAFSSSVAFKVLKKSKHLKPELLTAVDSNKGLLLFVGTKAAGKTTTACHLGTERRNSLLIDVEGNPAVEGSSAVLALMYDGMTKRMWLPVRFVPLPNLAKETVMTGILTFAARQKKRPTVIFDIHRSCTADAAALIAGIKVLNDDHGLIRAVVTATEGKAYAEVAHRDSRWETVYFKELSLQTAEKHITNNYTQEAKTEMLTLLPMTPLDPLVLTGGPEHMKKRASANALEFIKAFGLECTNGERKQFAQKALKGFADPMSTALKEVIIERAALEQTTPSKWFHNRFVESNMLANYTGEYEFQFEATRRLAEKLVEKEGDMDELKKQLKEEDWM
jgi:hypothetical protein